MGNIKGEHVRSIREKLELSQEELAERLGVHERTVRRWESEGCPELVARFLVKMVEEEE